MLIKQSSATRHIPFLMVDSSDHLTGKTGLSPTVTLSKNGGSFAAPAGAVTEIGNGWYKLAAHATDSNTLGQLVVHAESAGADTVDMTHDVVVFDPDDAAALGLSRINATISSRSSHDAAAVVTALHASTAEGSITVNQALQILLGLLAGKISGAGTNTMTIRNVSDTEDLVVATVDADGNRSAITLTLA